VDGSERRVPDGGPVRAPITFIDPLAVPLTRGKIAPVRGSDSNLS
jgi:hypothetical protein